MIRTARLDIVNFTAVHAEALLNGDVQLSKLLGVGFLDNWTEEKTAIQTFYNGIKNDPENIKWGSYLIIHCADKKLIGCGGFKGKPTANGIVEIGYEIHEDYRGQGLATEAEKGLVDFAL